ncbi:MAG: hypothetical protein ACREQQ_14515 [Candidatus Binatia bacterium]
MTTLRLAGSLILALAFEAAAQAPWPRDPTPERVTFMGGVGGLFPVGRFADAADSGFAPSIGGFFRANKVLAHAFHFQYGHLEADEQRLGGGETIHTFNLLTGPRLFIPLKGPVSPWVTGLIGWAHYRTDRELPLEPLFGVGDRTRNDVMLSIGGGLDFRLHPVFSVGIDARALFSIATSDSRGEDNLTAMTVSGLAMFHF